MDRRLFFKNLIGASAAVAVGPKLLGQMAEHDYTQNSQEVNVFHAGEGLWVFKDDKLVAWSATPGISLTWERPLIDVTRDPRFSTPENPVPPWKEYIGGHPEFTWVIDNLHVVDQKLFNMDEVVDIILKHREAGTIQSQGTMTEYSTMRIIPEVTEEKTISCRFRGYGECTINHGS